MLSKEDVLKNFLREDTEDVIKVYQAMSLAYNKGIPSFTKFFCKPNIWMYFIKNFSNNNFLVEAKGAFEECDRRILSFNNIYSIPFPYKIIKINNKSKFNNLSHKDYLGAIMALGIEREKLGDLRVIDNSAIVPVYDEVANYILYELKNVGKAPVSIEEITEDNLPISNFLQGVIIVPSLRLDNIVSKLANISRGKAVDIIDSGKVLIDYSKSIDKSKEVKDGQRVTISGVGKFIIREIVGNTKSGRYKVKMNKFI
ncbi:YlmH/Sll1252 family protein [Clostridium sp.]|jgi:RNA-binding protein YlmH|uniref:YlmH/Sll1252 family protein n=1 Tax=Clostridium sp. TaxID=1506 RepID=UPI0025C2F905|nr:YlmH/Sll1252 family protein [Clostridium sp.]MCI9069921.1 RNA-binding protein [Clostridium sp.]